VAGERKEIAVESADVDGGVRDRLGAIHQHQRSCLVGDPRNFRNRIHQTDHVRDMRVIGITYITYRCN
jgi:hypothetical protein